MKPQHTPAPWGVSKHATPDYAPQYGIYAGDGSASDHVIVRGDNAQADAALIAAAPDLLEALQELLEHIEWRRRIAKETTGANDCTHRARAAIAKAAQ